MTEDVTTQHFLSRFVEVDHKTKNVHLNTIKIQQVKNLSVSSFAKTAEILLRGETNFFVCSLKHYSVLIFTFSDIKHGYKIKI